MHLLRAVGTAATTTTMATTLALLPMPAAQADPPPSRDRADEVLAELRTRSQDAAAAATAYNAAREKLTVRATATTRISDRLARTRAALAASRADAGRLARRQYQGAASGLPPYVRLLLADDPQGAFHQLRVFQRAAEHKARAIRRLGDEERRLNGLRQRAARALESQRSLTAERRRQRDAARALARGARRLLAELPSTGPTRPRQRQGDGPHPAPRWPRAGGQWGDAPSAAGRRALRYALDQLGKPYGWGAAGPAAFDCSGLTSRAWSVAGYAIPRTSQEQWRRLPRVAVREVRPGDLVVYTGATHVALYVGDGLVVHAPRPGSTVRVAPLAFQPVLGAVRPDVHARPLASYAPPRVMTGGP